MTDNEIIKALECCSKETSDCGKCPYLYIKDYDNCFDFTKRDAFDLINRLQAEIDVKRKLLEKAEAKFESYENCERILICQLAEEREKAIKEFAERLKSKLYIESDNFNPVVTETDIDNLVKEMVGVNNAE